MDATQLTANDLEAIRQDAADRGDFETSRLCNAALWGETTRLRTNAKRKLSALLAKGASS